MVARGRRLPVSVPVSVPVIAPPVPVIAPVLGLAALRNSNKMLAAGAGAFKQLPNYVRDPDAPVSLFGYTNPSSVGAALSDWGGFTLASEDGTNELVRQILSPGCSNTSIRFRTEPDASAGF
jgi:hypothetical protein